MANGIVRNDNVGMAIGDQQDLAKVVESLVLKGDISGLGPAERARFYVQTCDNLGLNPAAQPFAFLRLNGKEVLYPTRGATDQLAAIHRVNREITRGPEEVTLLGTKMVLAVCRASLPNGRTETATATVIASDPCGPANVLMKVETKAKRRATLAILGLALLDEMEVETIRGAETVAPHVAAPPTDPDAPQGSRAWATYVEHIEHATTARRVRELYLGLCEDLREEGHDPAGYLADTTDTDGVVHAGGGTLAYRALGVARALGATEAGAVLGAGGEALATVLDAAADALPATEAAREYALVCAARWWVGHRDSLGTHAALVYRALARMATGTAPGDATTTKRASAALKAAVDRLTTPTPPTGTDAPTATASANGTGSEAAAPVGATAWQSSAAGIVAHAATWRAQAHVRRSVQAHAAEVPTALHHVLVEAAVGRLEALDPGDAHGTRVPRERLRQTVWGWVDAATQRVAA